MQATVNNQAPFNLDPKTEIGDLLDLGGGRFHLLKDNKSYNIEVVTVDEGSKEVEMIINGKSYAVGLKNEMDLLLESMGISRADASKVDALKAPMPGLILEISVAVGDTVQKGDPLLILEAMKMENVIKAAGDGVVASIEAAQGDAVEKGQLLIKFGD